MLRLTPRCDSTPCIVTPALSHGMIAHCCSKTAVGVTNHPFLGLPQNYIYAATAEFFNSHVHAVVPNPGRASMSVIVTVMRKQSGQGLAGMDEEAKLQEVEKTIADIAGKLSQDHQKSKASSSLPAGNSPEWPMPDIANLQRANRGGRGSKSAASSAGKMRREYGTTLVEVSIVGDNGVEYSNPILRDKFELCLAGGGKQYCEGKNEYRPYMANKYELYLPAEYAGTMGLKKCIGPDPFVKGQGATLKMLHVHFAAAEIKFEKGEVIPLSEQCGKWSSDGVIDTDPDSVGDINPYTTMWPTQEGSQGGKIQVKVVENWTPPDLEKVKAQAEETKEKKRKRKEGGGGEGRDRPTENQDR